ncbi:MAG TPA: VWA domain-containing protein [Pyrinomonadaceae bacterium]|nr:VWA domain-containing protein [Pyrinomonadaceae bacterium]
MRLKRITALALLASLCGAYTFAPPAASQGEEVVRIDTELVQTDVMVFDKGGKFVEGLKPEQFELKVDGRPFKIAFFERVSAGSLREQMLTAARAPDAQRGVRAPAAADRGRTIVFFADDVHLSAQSINKTRKAIEQFIEKEMAPFDQAVVASATGQIGFLQQFTDSPAVLRAALARLNHRSFVVRDMEHVPMSEYDALRVEAGDRDTLSHFSALLVKEYNIEIGGAAAGVGPPQGGSIFTKPTMSSGRPVGLTREAAEKMVKERASRILRESSNISMATLTSLETLVRNTAQYPGRKLVYFFSDGFYLNDKNTGFGDKLKRITDAALRSGVVIYTLDARGLVSMTDAGSNKFDTVGKLSRSSVGELAASQDPLFSLAEDTGGRALLNSEALGDGVSRALRDTSNYYLLAWRPETQEQRDGKFKRVEVSVVGRPDLTVRVARGFYDLPKGAAPPGDAAAKQPAASAAQPKTPDSEIREALLDFGPRHALPTLVDAGFIDTPANGPVLAASAQVAADALSYGADGKQPANVELAGIILNTDGKSVGGFKTRLSNIQPIPPERRGAEADSVTYTHRTPLAPGIYQVRVAARDEQSGRVGSARKWVEIPDLKSGQLTLSSLLVGEQKAAPVGAQNASAPRGAGAGPEMSFSVDHRFARASRLNFVMFIYNAARPAGGPPDLAAQVQVFRDSQTIVNTPLRPLSVEGVQDLSRVPYFGSFPLQTLSPGRYLLQVNVTDRAGQRTAAQRTGFIIE